MNFQQYICLKKRQGSGGLIRIPFVGKWSAPRWLVSACVYGWFALVVVWFIGECFFGCGVNSDEYYMALCCRDYANQPIAMLTFYVGWLATQLFGDQLITLRLLGYFSVLVGVGVPGWYCYRKTHSLRWVLFIVSCVLVTVRSQWLLKWYGWDLGPIMFEGILITLVISLYDRLTLRRVAGIGAVAALTVLARVPTAVVVVPVCFAALWYAIKDIPDRRRCYLRYAGVGVLSFLSIFMLCVWVMKGSPVAYVASWQVDNIINGHGVQDFPMFLAYLKWDAHIELCGIWVSKYALAGIVLLCLFSRRCRYVPALIFLGYLFYRKLMLPNGMCVPGLTFSLIVILFPFMYNLKSQVLGENSHLAIDMRKFWTILVFGLVVVIGSDRMILRIGYYYMFPLLLIPLYPVRRGMIFWTMLFFTLPSFVFSVNYRITNRATYRSMEEEMPSHKYILEDHNLDLYISPCGQVIDFMNHEGTRVTTFSDGRNEILYLYGKGRPYRFNLWHLYTEEEYISALDDFTSSQDAIVVEYHDDPVFRKKREYMMRKRNFYNTALPGKYVVYEHIEPERFLSVSEV